MSTHLREAWRQRIAAAEWTPGDPAATRCTEVVLNAFGIHGRVPISGAGVLEALMDNGWTYADTNEEGKTVRRFCADHPSGRYYLMTSNGGHGMAVIDGVLHDYEGRGADGRRVVVAYEVYRPGERTANWRAQQATAFWSLYDAVIATDQMGSRRSFDVWTYGENIAQRPSLAEAKAVIEEVYGPQSWRRVTMPPVIYNHYYFGPTTEMTDPTTVLVVDHLPKLGKLAAANEWKKLTNPVRCRLIEAADYVGDRTTGPEIGQVNYGIEGSIPAGTEGTVLAWVQGDTVPVFPRAKHKVGDHFLVSFPGVPSPLLLGEDQIDLLDPVPRRKTAIHGVIPWRVRYQGPINVHQPRPVKLDPMAVHDYREVLYQDEQRKAKEAIEALQAGRAPLEPKTRDLAGTYGIRVDEDCRLLAYPHIDGAWHVMYLGRHDYEEAAHRWANPPDMQRAASLTLYRGEGTHDHPSYYVGPDADMAGGWWTTDLASASQYAKSTPGGQVYVIEVDESEVERRGLPQYRFIPDPEVRARRRLYP